VIESGDTGEYLPTKLSPWLEQRVDEGRDGGPLAKTSRHRLQMSVMMIGANQYFLLLRMNSQRLTNDLYL